MSSAILWSARPPSKAPARPHDPNLCGLGFDSDCDVCRAAYLRDERALYERDADVKRRAHRCVVARRMRETTGTNLGDLGAALLPVQAEGMAEIAGAVFDEREATE